ncbi:phosphorylated carbohydrates phosphatase [Synergistales bacterium]|nr:phosphorylated carbohydrates phosphatase [Synergistales bacterium]
MLPLLEAVIFDMDGLMFDTEMLNMKGWKYAAKLHGYEISDEMIHSHVGMTVAAARRQMADHFGQGFDFDAVRKDRVYFSTAFIEEHGTPLKPGLKELLAHLRSARVKTAIASSTEEPIVRFNLEHARLGHDFDAVVCGDRVRNGKPEPDIFFEALKDLGIGADEALVLEDSYNGIRAAYRAGIRSVMVPDTLPSTPEMESMFFGKCDDLFGVIDIIDELC